MFAHSKVMFEIYRDAGYGRLYRVVYFTELDEHHRDAEINRALSGEHFLDGFLQEGQLAAAKPVISGLLERLNKGESLTADEFHSALAAFSA